MYLEPFETMRTSFVHLRSPVEHSLIRSPTTSGGNIEIPSGNRNISYVLTRGGSKGKQGNAGENKEEDEEKEDAEADDVNA